MKKVILYTLVTIFVVLPLTGISEESSGGKNKDQLNLTVDLGVVAITSSSTLDTNGEAKIDDNTEKGESPQRFWALPLFDLKYSFPETQTQLFVGTPIDGSDISLAVGAAQPLPNIGILSASIAPSIGAEVWKNPYEENVNRAKTGVNQLTSKLKLDKVAFSPFSVTYTNQTIDVDDDEIGQANSELERDGVVNTLETSYMLGLSKTSMLTPGLKFESADKEGDANSYSQTGISINYKSMMESMFLMIEVSYETYSFQEEHPIYDKTRKENGVGFFTMLRFPNLFDVANLHSNVMFGAGTVDSNIDFFDVDTKFVATTVGYSF